MRPTAVYVCGLKELADNLCEDGHITLKEKIFMKEAAKKLEELQDKLTEYKG